MKLVKNKAVREISYEEYLANLDKYEFTSYVRTDTHEIWFYKRGRKICKLKEALKGEENDLIPGTM